MTIWGERRSTTWSRRPKACWILASGDRSLLRHCCANSWNIGSPLRHQFHYRGENMKKWNHISSPQLWSYVINMQPRSPTTFLHQNACRLQAECSLGYRGRHGEGASARCGHEPLGKLFGTPVKRWRLLNQMEDEFMMCPMHWSKGKNENYDSLCAKAGRPTWCCTLNFRRWIQIIPNIYL